MKTNEILEHKLTAVYQIEGFGQVGYANLETFCPFSGLKYLCELEIGETTEGILCAKLSDKRPERITRIR